jgi:hypothetical protein
MKKYFKIDNLEDFGMIQYAEFDDGYVVREVNFYDLNFDEHSDKEAEWESSVDGENLGLKGLSLDYLELPLNENITSEEFEKVWQQALKLHKQPKGEKIKKRPKTTQLSPEKKKKQNDQKREVKKFWKGYWQNFPDTTYDQGKDLVISGTEDTPNVYFDNSKGNLLIEGRSLLDDSALFYARLDSWLGDYLKNNPQKKITLILNIEYINTQGHSCLLGFIQNIPNKNNSRVNWHFETEDQEDQGLDMADLFDIPFFLINKTTGEKYQA